LKKECLKPKMRVPSWLSKKAKHDASEAKFLFDTTYRDRDSYCSHTHDLQRDEYLAGRLLEL
jgi:hypothetical protein